MPHNTLTSWLHPGYKNWAAISPAQLLRPCSLGMVNLARERALNKACLTGHRSTIWSSNTTLGDIPKRLLLQRHLHIHVYCGTIHNSQVMETAKMPHHWWMV
jgi:hypothetical protein